MPTQLATDEMLEENQQEEEATTQDVQAAENIRVLYKGVRLQKKKVLASSRQLGQDQRKTAADALGTDPYADPECLACNVLPICGGGCANKRLRAKRFGEAGLLLCSPYKEHLAAYLEEYYDSFLSREICAAVLTPGVAVRDETGYRVVSPQPQKRDHEAAVMSPVADPV